MSRSSIFTGAASLSDLQVLVVDDAPENARILAVTLNGQIRSDIPLTMKDQFGPRFGETTLGNGEPVMSLDVVKGDIAISVAR